MHLLTGNMERLAMSNAHQKTHDPMREYHLSQKKALEINPRHPLIKGNLFYALHLFIKILFIFEKLIFDKMDNSDDSFQKKIFFSTNKFFFSMFLFKIFKRKKFNFILIKYYFIY